MRNVYVYGGKENFDRLEDTNYVIKQAPVGCEDSVSQLLLDEIETTRARSNRHVLVILSDERNEPDVFEYFADIVFSYNPENSRDLSIEKQRGGCNGAVIGVIGSIVSQIEKIDNHEKLVKSTFTNVIIPEDEPFFDKNIVKNGTAIGGFFPMSCDMFEYAGENKVEDYLYNGIIKGIIDTLWDVLGDKEKLEHFKKHVPLYMYNDSNGYLKDHLYMIRLFNE